MDANWIRLGLLAVVLVAVSTRVVAGEPDYQDYLTTLDGKTFHQVRLVKVDPNGLLFRHRDGIAKVTFDDLDQVFREHYGYHEALARDFEKKHSGGVKKARVQPISQPAADEPVQNEVVITFRVRTFIPLSTVNPYANEQTACGGIPWFSHWPRFHPALAYSRFPCRQMAERDLLISSGILPNPGVAVRRFRRW